MTVQAVTKVPSDTRARQLVVSSCQEVLSVLQGVFVLDPVPAQMRGYARIGADPDRNGSTVSAITWALRDTEAWPRLNALISSLVETRLSEVTFAEATLPDRQLTDVMVALSEVVPGRKDFLSPARIMSDGSLRYLAIVATLLNLTPSERPKATSPVRRTLLLEEIENGLYPTQSARMLDLVREEAGTRQVQLMFTTHSPALLDSLETSDHRGVMVCERDARGWSHLTPLVAHSRYVDIAGSGRVGTSLTSGALSPPKASTKRLSLAELLDNE